MWQRDTEVRVYIFYILYVNSNLIFAFVFIPAPFLGKAADSTQPYLALSRSLSPSTQPESHLSTTSPYTPRSCNFFCLTTPAIIRLPASLLQLTSGLRTDQKKQRKDNQRRMKIANNEQQKAPTAQLRAVRTGRVVQKH